jgi:hypothetical protein
MNDRRANIDFVFRNGLKDYEVLPPAETWDHIRPVIREKQLPVIILRAAAMIAVVLSLSFLAYRWSMEISSSGLENNTVAQAPESEAPAGNAPAEVIQPGEGTTVRLPVIAEASFKDIKPEVSVIPGGELNAIQNIIYQPENGRVSVNSQGTFRRDIPVLRRVVPETVSFEEADPLYSPAIPVKNQSNRWSVAALVSPTYYTNIYSGSDDLGAREISDEQALFSYSGGVAFSYKINKRLSVQSGLYYSSFGQELSGITTFGGFKPYDYTKGDRNFEVLTASGIVYTNNADVFLFDNLSDNRISTRYTNDVFDPAKANLEFLDNSLRQNFSYLELPVFLRYKILDKTVDFNIIGGLSSNLLVNNSVYASLDGSKYRVGKTEGLSLITFSSSLGLGMEYNFTNNLSLNLEPTFRYYLNPFSEISGLRIHPYSLGIFSGISFRF